MLLLLWRGHEREVSRHTQSDNEPQFATGYRENVPLLLLLVVIGHPLPGIRSLAHSLFYHSLLPRAQMPENSFCESNPCQFFYEGKAVHISRMKQEVYRPPARFNTGAFKNEWCQHLVIELVYVKQEKVTRYLRFLRQCD